MSGHIAPLLLLLAAAPVWMQERAKRCVQPPSINDAPIAVAPVPGLRWTDRNQCGFERRSVSDAGVTTIERGRITVPERTKKGWVLGECVTFRRVASLGTTTQTWFRCGQKLKEVESSTAGTTVTSVFSEDSGVLVQKFTERALLGGERALRCEWFAPDGGVVDRIEYGVRTRDGCVPVGSPFAPEPSSRTEYHRL